MISKIRLITTKISLLDLSKPAGVFEMASCGLKWKQNKLWVQALDRSNGVRLPAMTHAAWLQDCLHHSPVEAVCLDSSISQLDLERWLTACSQINKPVFLRLNNGSTLPESPSASWRLKRLADWCGALLLLLGLSPLGLALALWTRASASVPLLERDWRVGRRGKLFQMFKFRPQTAWMQRSHLAHLPQLLNVLTGEMSLVGPRPWEPADALRCPDQPALNALPGISGIWQLSQATSPELSPPHGLD